MYWGTFSVSRENGRHRKPQLHRYWVSKFSKDVCVDVHFHLQLHQQDESIMWSISLSQKLHSFLAMPRYSINNSINSIMSHGVICRLVRNWWRIWLKKEYSTYYGPDGRSDTTSNGAKKFMSERKIFPFSIRSFWQICTTQKLAWIVNIVSCFSMI